MIRLFGILLACLIGAAPAGVLVFAPGSAGAAQPIVAISGGGAVTLSAAAHDEKTLLIDATGGATILDIQDIAALGAGFHVPVIYKTDPGSNLVGVRVLKSGDRLNHFWTFTAADPLWLNMTQQAAELVCDGVSNCYLMGKSYHHNVGQSQRTFTTGTHNVRSQDLNEEIAVSAPAGGMGIYFDPVANFSPPSSVTGGNYHSHWVRFRRVDAGGQLVRIFAFYAQAINQSSYIDLMGINATLTCYITAAQIWCG